jgi:hypothetical protein
VKDVIEKETKMKETRTVYSFDLQTPDRIFTLASHKKSEAEEWKRLINSAIRCLRDLKD